MHRTAFVTRSDNDDTTLNLPQEASHVGSPGALPATTFALRVLAGPDAGASIQLDPSGPPHSVVGIASSCAIQLTDRHISRRHIALTATPTHVLLVDLGSTNGTKVNGVLVREARLYGGETIEIGRTTLGIENDGARPSNEQPVAQPASDYLANVLAEHLSFPAARQRVVAEFERRYVEDLLARHNGNVTHAARASGVAHRYFQLVRARSR
jgi:pSer/pThr/pTyr-binding forkhead associated (FHA) protein